MQAVTPSAATGGGAQTAPAHAENVGFSVGVCLYVEKKSGKKTENL